MSEPIAPDLNTFLRSEVRFHGMIELLTESLALQLDVDVDHPKCSHFLWDLMALGAKLSPQEEQGRGGSVWIVR